MKTKFEVGELVGRKHDTKVGMVWRVHVGCPTGLSYYVRWPGGYENWWADANLKKL